MAKSGIASFPDQVLGYGVDGTSPAPLSNRNTKTLRPLRIVTMSGASANIIQEKPARTVNEASYSLESTDILQANCKGSFDGPLKSVKVQIEVEYACEKDVQIHSTCIKHYTRYISFRPISEGTPNWSESKFQEKLYEMFIEKIPEFNGIKKNSMYDEIGKKLDQPTLKLKKSLVDTAYNFIKKEGITHYVHKIDLGAAKYTLSVSNTETKQKKGGASVTVPIAGVGDVGIGGGAEKSDSLSTQRSETQHIGRMGEDNAVIVKPGDSVSEGVIGYYLHPVTELIKNEAVKRLVRDAVLQYFHEAEGPFIISGGKRNTIYLKVTPEEEVFATQEKSEASLFKVKKTVPKGEFMICYIGSQQDYKENKHETPQYLMANSSKWTGNNKGPLKVTERASTSAGAKFILMTFPDDKDKSPYVDIDKWETERCFLRVAPRRFQVRSYVGLKEDPADIKNSITVCRNTKKEDGKDNVCLQFQIHRPELGGHHTVFRGPPGGSGAASSSEGIYDFEGFSEDYDQVLDSGDEGFDFD